MLSGTRTRTTGWFAVAALITAFAAPADTLRAGEEVFEGVYVKESAHFYHVFDPDTGDATAVWKADVAPGDVTLLEDEDERRALKRRWAAKRLARREAVEPRPAQETGYEEPLRGDGVDAGPTAAEGEPAAVDAVPEEASPPFPGGTRIRQLPLRTALKVILRQRGLDYRVFDDYIYISTPERLRTEPFEPLETRAFGMALTAGEALPKVVVRTSGGPGGVAHGTSLAGRFGTAPAALAGEAAP